MIAKIIVVVIALGALLMGGAIVKNKVPLTEPPGLVKRLTSYLTRNAARTRAGHEFPELRSRSYDLRAHQVLALAVRAARQAGWTVAGVDADRRGMDAVVVTRWLRFRDDVRVTVRETGGGGTLVEVESRSRLGRADYGANIAHVIELHRRLDELVK